MWRPGWLVGMFLLAGGCWADETLYYAQQPAELSSARTDIRLQSKSAALDDFSVHGNDMSLALVLSGIWANKAPSAGYQLYLNVPPGVRPQPTDPGHVGDVSFYGAPDHYSREHPRQAAFFLDEVLVRLRAAGRLAAAPTLTLVPSRTDRPDVRARIEEISIVVISR